MKPQLSPTNDERFRALWFDSKTAAAYVGCKSIKAWYEWKRRRGIIKLNNGKVNRADLDRALTVRTPRRYGGSVHHPNSLANLQRGGTQLMTLAERIVTLEARVAELERRVIHAR